MALPAKAPARLLTSSYAMPKLQTAAAAFRNTIPGSSYGYKGKPLLPGIPVQIEIHKERIKKRPDRYIRVNDKSNNVHANNFLEDHVHYLTSLCHSPTAYTPMTILGRFVGPGFTQQGYACSKLLSPYYFIDGIVVHDTEEYVSCPERICDMLESPLGLQCPISRVLPWIAEIHPNVKDERPYLRELLAQTGNIDAYIKSEFKIDGPGEGAIFYPQSDFLTIKELSQFGFIAATTRNVDLFASMSTRIGAEAARHVQNFVDANISPEIISSVAGDIPLDKRFTRRVMNDVLAATESKIKEACKAEPLLQKREVENAVTRIAAEWFVNKCNQL
uniref:Uncharacterized protein n=1 Tax=Spongospora subterranea TaxID=70186 RepID=A0A0H5RLH6_9EUKA|eukprot:CRZ09584.1 hypothetical protein [Spongospora subterranea]